MPSNLKRVSDMKPVKVPADFDRTNQEHVNVLRKGAQAWNQWRQQNPDVVPHLAYVRFRRADFSGYNFDGALLPFCILSRCAFKGTTFRGADLRGASLRRTDLTDADLDGAILRHVSLAECVVEGAVFSNCHIYGISAWNLVGEPKDQANMVMKAEIEEAGITIDDLEVAQFIFLLLNNPKIRGVIDTVTSKTVLILGRFTKQRKAVLDRLRLELRKLDFVPVLFDFEKPATRDISETVSLLAQMSRFVIADITDARSIPQELQKIVPNAPSLPIRPIILEDQFEYAMFKDFGAFLSVLPPFRYRDTDHLLDSLREDVIKPALDRADEIVQRRKAFEAGLSG